MTSAAGPSKNPFLSPSHTGSSQQPLPNLHDAFRGLAVSSPHDGPPPTVPSSTRPNNPFVDAPQPPSSPSRPLSQEELQAFENPSGPLAWQPTGQSAGGPTSAPSPNNGAHQQAMSPTLYAPLSPSQPNGYASSTQLSSPPPRERKEEGYDVPPSPTGPSSQPAASTSSAQAGPASNGAYVDDQAALDAAIAASLGERPPSPGPPASSDPTPTTTYAPPPGPPPNLPARPAPPTRASSAEAPASADPPPAYTPVNAPTSTGETTLDAGPMRPAWTEPEPRPFQQQQQHHQQQQWGGGVGVQPQHTGWSDGGGNPGGFITPQSTGFRPPGGPPPPLPNRTPSTSHRPPPPQHHHSNSHGPPPPPTDPTPSAMPIPGRPYLNNSQVLVYSPGFMCPKCQNTGYKFNDPTHPCRTCWKKYGRPYTSAMAHSWSTNPGGAGVSNWQRPLGVRPTMHYGAPAPGGYPGNVGGWQGGGGGGMGGGMYQGGGGGGGGIYQRGVVPPAGAIVYQPGDPRIGGRLCYRCGGRGVIEGFFENDQCRACGGVGRLF